MYMSGPNSKLLQVWLPYRWTVVNIITVGEHQNAERHIKYVDIEILKSPQELKNDIKSF